MERIIQIAGYPGSGKTLKALRRIKSTPGRYVYSASRKDLLDDAKTYLLDSGFSGQLDVVYCQSSSKYNVDERIRQWLVDYADSTHAVLMITHAALIDAAKEQFRGTSLIIDEVPSNAIMTGTLHCRASLPAVKQLFDLEPDPQCRTNIMGLKACPATNVHDILEDPYLAGLANIWKRARQGEVFIECTPRTHQDTGTIDAWADIARKKCSVLSVWSFDELEAFDDVSIVAAGLEHSLVHKCNPRSYALDQTVRPPSKASVRIHYFDAVTMSGSTYFASAEGIANIDKIGDYLKELAEQNEPLGYWTTNSKVKDQLQIKMPAGYCSPMQEGSNRLRDKKSCAAFYSAKRTPADNLLCRIYGITDEDLQRAREWEHLGQFVMRGAVRDHDYAGRYDVYVYDQAQADRLAKYMEEIGFADVLVDQIDLGLARPEPKKAGRSQLLSVEERHERKKKRDRDRYAKHKQPKI